MCHCWRRQRERRPRCLPHATPSHATSLLFATSIHIYLRLPSSYLPLFFFCSFLFLCGQLYVDCLLSSNHRDYPYYWCFGVATCLWSRRRRLFFFVLFLFLCGQLYVECLRSISVANWRLWPKRRRRRGLLDSNLLRNWELNPMSRERLLLPC